jgi:hypothetical protein
MVSEWRPYEDAPFPEPIDNSFIHIAQSPQLNSSPTKERENRWSRSTDPHAD